MEVYFYKKSFRTFILPLAFLSFLSCTMQRKDRIAQHDDFFNRFSKIELKAMGHGKIMDDVLILRKNKTFRYYTKVFGLVNSGYYTGRYSFINDSTIHFIFNKNYKPALFLTDTVKYINSEDHFSLIIDENQEFRGVKNK